MLKIALLLFVSTYASANLFNFGMSNYGIMPSNAGVSISGDANGSVRPGLGSLINTGMAMVNDATSKISHPIDGTINLANNFQQNVFGTVGKIHKGLTDAIESGKGSLETIIGDFCNQFQDIKMTLGGLLAAGAEIPENLIDQFHTIANQVELKLINKLTNIEKQIINVSGVTKDNLMKVKEQIKQEIQKIVKQTQDLNNYMSDKLKKCQQQRLNILNNIKEEIGKEVENIEQNVESGAEKINRLIEQQVIEIDVRVNQLKRQLAETKQYVTEESQKLAEELKTQINTMLTTAQTNLEEELKRIDNQLETASEEARKILNELKTEIQNKIRDIEKKLEDINSVTIAVGTDDNGVDANGVDANGVDDNGVDDNGVDANGVDDNGVDDNGVDDNGVDANGVDDNGVDDNGVDDNGVDDNGVDDNGVDDNGADDNGAGAANLDVSVEAGNA
ncbi:probable ATP-dependent helicase PF08_0048 [Oppia nitens]|uniref:probable ATP-dependent helicase PF08_0048 n=1 Tax=Oppia nitens TaxID=1686743 RepID=UPI0023DABE3E|nr:probable ATP-dependent helicase PF08_0048 [Oppia nitens]